MRNQWNEFFVVNFIALGYIAFTLLAQFGIHIKVDQGVNLVPVEIGYSQSTRHINSNFVLIAERHERLKHENNAQKSIWVSASVVFKRASDDDIEDMIKYGDSIKRNVFIIQNTMKLSV